MSRQSPLFASGGLGEMIEQSKLTLAHSLTGWPYVGKLVASREI